MESLNVEFILDKVYKESSELKDYYPKQQTPGSAGVDLVVPRNVYMPASSDVISVGTGLRVWINDPNYVGLIFPRSSLGTRGIILANTVGVIDSDYQGELILNLINRSSVPITLTIGQRVAQLVFVRTPIVFMNEQSPEFSSLTQRGTGGFGSTGA